jgi:hypothetical protein
MTLPYASQQVALLTQHGKEALIGPLMQQALGCEVLRASGFDTDRLGTFSGEVPRPDSQLNTARQKARIGMDLLDLPLGLASEGAFVPDPFGGLLPWNIELWVWLDDLRQLEVVGMAQGPARNFQRTVQTETELQHFANEAGFPEHQLMLRAAGVPFSQVHKGLHSHPQLQRHFKTCKAESPSGQVVAESDLRALANPTRQAMIVRAAHDLISKLASLCPACQRPGYCAQERLKGLPCRSCGLPTRLAQSLLWRCQGCQHTEVRAAGQESHADPSRCDHCNP